MSLKICSDKKNDSAVRSTNSLTRLHALILICMFTNKISSEITSSTYAQGGHWLINIVSNRPFDQVQNHHYSWSRNNQTNYFDPSWWLQLIWFDRNFIGSNFASKIHSADDPVAINKSRLLQIERETPIWIIALLLTHTQTQRRFEVC